MIKLSKKELKEFAEYNNGLYFTGNVYSYENIIYYLDVLLNKKRNNDIENIDYYIEQLEKNINVDFKENLKKLIKKVIDKDFNDYRITQDFYSCGYYGNSGQLHKLVLYKNDSIVDLIYLYY